MSELDENELAYIRRKWKRISVILAIAGLLCSIVGVACGLLYKFGGSGVKGNSIYLIAAIVLTCTVVLITAIFLGGFKTPLSTTDPGHIPSAPLTAARRREETCQR